MSHVEDPLIKCQNCKLPLKIDSSLLDLSLAQKDLLVSSTNDYAPAKYRIPQDRLQRLDKLVYPKDLKLPKSELDSYVFLHDDSKRNGPLNDSSVETSTQTLLARRDDDSGDEQLDEDLQHGYHSASSRTLSTQVSALANVFNILSSKNNIDYPVCQDCCNLLIQRLQSEYDDAIRERDTYTQFLSRIEKQRQVPQTDRTGAISEEGAKLQAERESLFQNLLKLEKRDEELDEHIAELEKQLENKKRLEVEELGRENMQELEQMEFSREVHSLKKQYELALNNLDKLRKVNIYNETFKISHEGPFGIINGLRIGGFDGVRVPWQEINAALGQIVFLFATITTALKMRMDGYKLRPMGSYSKISKFKDDTQEWETYEAYSSDGFKLGKLFRKETSLDKAMECLLEVVQIMATWLARTSSGNHEQGSNNASTAESGGDEAFDIELPYIMHKDKINGESVKLFGGKPTIEWTTAMKCLLTNAKWLLAFSSSRLAQTSSK